MAMLQTRELSSQHAFIMDQSRRLCGLVADVGSRGDAMVVRRLIEAIDGFLVEHLSIEDGHLYPALMKSGEAEMRDTAISAFEDMGGLCAVWGHYRDHWTTDRILSDPRRFRAATDDIIGALSLRIAMEESVLYPAFDALQSGNRGASAAA
jgi:hypothetical protein